MKSLFSKTIGALIVLVLLAYMFCFQLRYDQVAVVSTFGKARAPVSAADGKIEDPGSVRTQAGLYFQWPWPIQKVTRYSTLVRVLEEQLEEFQTADGSAVVVRAYVAWRIRDPLAFYNQLTDVDNARDKLLPLVRDTKAIIGQYRFDQLVNTDPRKVQLDRVESEAAGQLQARADAQGYGIEVVQFGFRRLVLPEKVTERVFERMKADRKRRAEDARASGNAQAQAIESQATAAAGRIAAFAQRRAQAIRAQGDAEAAAVYSDFAQDQDLAIFLRRLQTLEKILPNNTTFVLPAEQLSLQELLGGDAADTKPAPAKKP